MMDKMVGSERLKNHFTACSKHALMDEVVGRLFLFRKYRKVYTVY